MSVIEPHTPLEYDLRGLPMAGGRLWYYSATVGRWIKVVHAIGLWPGRPDFWQMHNRTGCSPVKRRPDQMERHASNGYSEWAPWSDQPPSIPKRVRDDDSV